ncbi:unnamed protein product [Amoebophrya sp. A25]|nr:unnamed protein product [Amoebophrya sp. A25]|eukprot:GSA25T00024449001.1
MWHDRALAQDPVRYTAATMEMMRLEDVPTLRCAVNYACDHSYGHLANAVSATYFANKEWISKDQAKAAFIQEQFEKNPELQRQKLLRRAEKNLAPPYAWDGKGTFYGHKETSCFGYVTAKGRHRADLTGIDVEDSHPIFRSIGPGRRRLLNDEYARRYKPLPYDGSYSPRNFKKSDKNPRTALYKGDRDGAEKIGHVETSPTKRGFGEHADDLLSEELNSTTGSDAAQQTDAAVHLMYPASAATSTTSSRYPRLDNLLDKIGGDTTSAAIRREQAGGSCSSSCSSASSFISSVLLSTGVQKKIRMRPKSAAPTTRVRSRPKLTTVLEDGSKNKTRIEHPLKTGILEHQEQNQNPNIGPGPPGVNATAAASASKRSTTETTTTNQAVAHVEQGEKAKYNKTSPSKKRRNKSRPRSAAASCSSSGLIAQEDIDRTAKAIVARVRALSRSGSSAASSCGRASSVPATGKRRKEEA